MRAVMEGVTYALRDSLELMRRLGIDATESVAVGGGARSVFWRQMQADVLGVPVVTVGPSGGAPYGAAVLAAVGSGDYGSVKEACQAWIRPVDRIDPRSETAGAYGLAYERYRNLYRETEGPLRGAGAEVRPELIVFETIGSAILALGP